MNRVQDTSHFDVLSVRERQVMLLAAKGLANKLIARELHIAEGTVKQHYKSERSLIHRLAEVSAS